MSRDANLGSNGLSLPDKTSPRTGAACDQDDRGEQDAKLGQSHFHILNIAHLRVATLTQVNAANWWGALSFKLRDLKAANCTKVFREVL